MEVLLRVLFWCPRCWRVIGGWLFSACGLLALLGLRLMNRAERIERKTGVHFDLDKVIESLPFPVPTTAEGFAFAVFGALGYCWRFAGSGRRSKLECRPN